LPNFPVSRALPDPKAFFVAVSFLVLPFFIHSRTRIRRGGPQGGHQAANAWRSVNFLAGPIQKKLAWQQRVVLNLRAMPGPVNAATWCTTVDLCG